MNYEIFISYRREGGKEFARPLKSELEKRGYRVFLDFDELKDGRFDKRIMEAIDSASIFITILSPHSLDRCVNASDWVRQEIEYAFEHEKHIIPVNPDRQFKDFPETTPEKLRQALGQHQFSEIMMGMLFKESMDKMVKDRIVPILGSRGGQGVGQRFATEPTASPAAQGLFTSVLKVETDLDCRVVVDGEDKGVVTAGSVKRIALRGGSYRLRFVAVEDSNFVVEEKRFHIERDTEEWYSVVMMPMKEKEEEKRREEEKKETEEQRKAAEEAKRKAAEEAKRKAAEERRIQNLLQLPDEAFKPTKISERRFQYLDAKGNVILPFVYEDAWNFCEGLAVVKKNGKFGFIDKTGKEVIPLVYDVVAPVFYEGLAKVKKNGKWGFVDKTGKEVIPLVYDVACDFDKGLARVTKNGKCGFVDKIGKEIIPFVYDSEYIFAYVFDKGLAHVRKNGKWGFVDKTGKEVIPPLAYDTVTPFHEGLARVKKKGKWGFVDKTGKEVIRTIYDEANRFINGKARAKKDGKWGYIDKTGKFTKDSWISQLKKKLWD